MVELLESQAAIQMRAERGTDDVSNPCSLRKASAARSPMMMHGAMVFPVVTRGMIEPSAMKVFDSIDVKLGVYDLEWRPIFAVHV